MKKNLLSILASICFLFSYSQVSDLNFTDFTPGILKSVLDISDVNISSLNLSIIIQ